MADTTSFTPTSAQSSPALLLVMAAEEQTRLGLGCTEEGQGQDLEGEAVAVEEGAGGAHTEGVVGCVEDQT